MMIVAEPGTLWVLQKEGRVMRRLLVVMGLGILLLSWSWVEATSWEEMGKLDEHWTLSGSLRTRWENWHWFNPGDLSGAAGENDNNTYNFFATQLRLGIKYQYDPWEAFVQMQDTRLLSLPSDAGAPTPFGPLGLGALYFAHNQDQDQGRPFLKQAYLHIKNLQELLCLPGVSLKLGRFEYMDGLEVVPDPKEDPKLNWLKTMRISQRLIGPFGWSHVTRSFDGVQAGYDQQKFNFTAFWSKPTQGGLEIDAQDQIKDIDLAAATLTLKKGTLLPNSEARLFYIFYNDERDVLKVDNRPLALRRSDGDDIDISTIGGNFIGAYPLGPGQADLLLWAAYQTGDWGKLDQQSWAWALETGYQLSKLPWKPWLRAGYFQGSGDDNQTDSDHKTFFQIMPTARLYSFSTFYNLMNNEDFFLQLLLKPLDNLSCRTDFHNIRLNEENDLWYFGAGATRRDKIFGYGARPSLGNKSLLNLIEFSISYDLTKYLNLNAYYSHLFGNEVVQEIYRGDDADFWYLEANIKF